MASSKSHLRLLGEIITNSIDKIETRLAQAEATFPSLAEPYNPSANAEAILLEPDIISATSLIVAAASQLIATVRDPAKTLIDDTLSFHLGSCLRAVIESDVVEIVREAGPQGIHVNDISRRNATDPLKLSRILRLLANQYIFKEVFPDVFAANRLSSMIDTGKSSRELAEKPEEKYLDTPGLAAFVCMLTDEGLKGSAYMTEEFKDPKTSHSVQPSETPWNIAFKTSKTFFQWYDQPENKIRSERFSVAMKGTTKMEPRDAILSGFQWNSLPAGSIIVDVGGGLGSSSLIIAQAHSDLNIVVQDRLRVVENAQQYWETNLPEALKAGRVKLQSHDFLQPQPIKNAAVFLLRLITHDWADPFLKKILTHLRDVATTDTKLLTIDSIVPYTCIAHITDEITGSSRPKVPEPLLPSLGKVNNVSYFLDLQMYVFFNSQDRTLGHFVRVAAECGWKVERVYNIPGSAFSQCVSVPIVF